MSQFPPPPPPGSSGTGLSAEAQPYTQPPMSRAAVFGFIASLLICIPFLAQILGLIWGIVGVAATAGGRRRGRGLAIAAIPISIVLLALMSFATYGFVQSYFGMERAVRSVQPLFRSSESVASAVRDFYPKTTRRFQQQVDEDTLTNWLQDAITEHGTLQNWQLARPAVLSDSEGRILINFNGQFTSGTAKVTVVLITDNPFEAEVDDLLVAGDSPLPNP